MKSAWKLKVWRRWLFESFGRELFSKPASKEIHAMLLREFSHPGFFFEAGAMDGFYESNTYYLEKFRGWSGVLVEPQPDIFQKIAYARPHAKAYNCALVASGYHSEYVDILESGACSRVCPPKLSEANQKRVVRVPARTITSILDESAPAQIDLLSLDVEGYEMEVLHGLDFDKYRPRKMLIESLSDVHQKQIADFLSPMYRCVKRVTERDYLYEIF